MIVGFDGYFMADETSALGATERNLVLRLAEVDRDDSFVVFVTQAGLKHLPALPNVKGVVLSEPRLHNAVGRVRSIERAVKALDQRLDVYIETCEISPRFGSSVTIFSFEHDFSQGTLERPLSFARVKGMGYRFLHVRSIRRTRAFFCNSQFTLDQLKRYLEPAQDAVVFPHGCEQVFREGASEGLTGSENPARQTFDRYLLFVGRVQVRHKNLTLLLRAFAELSERLPDLRLVVVSSQEFSREQRRLVGKMADRVSLLRGLNTAEIARLYRSASALVMTSTYEGFGVPIIEAQSLGCPVVLNDIAVFREVAGDGGIFFDGTASDLVRKLEFVLESQNTESYVRLGLQNSRRFSWETTAAIVRDRLASERRRVRPGGRTEN